MIEDTAKSLYFVYFHPGLELVLGYSFNHLLCSGSKPVIEFINIYYIIFEQIFPKLTRQWVTHTTLSLQDLSSNY